MIVYNVTNKILPRIETGWVQWMKEEHIPEIMATGLFTDYKFFRLLDPVEEEGITYVVQYFSSSLENYQTYIEQFSSQLRKKVTEKWNDQFVAFRTVMQVVH